MAGEPRVAGEHRVAGESRVAREHRVAGSTAWQGSISRDFQKNDFLKSQKEPFCKKYKKTKKRDQGGSIELDERLLMYLTRAP